MTSLVTSPHHFVRCFPFLRGEGFSFFFKVLFDPNAVDPRTLPNPHLQESPLSPLPHPHGLGASSSGRVAGLRAIVRLAGFVVALLSVELWPSAGSAHVALATQNTPFGSSSVGAWVVEPLPVSRSWASNKKQTVRLPTELFGMKSPGLQVPLQSLEESLEGPSWVRSDGAAICFLNLSFFAK